MEPASAKKDEIIKYLLGELPEGAQAAIEDRFFDDDELFARMTEVENDLIDDYLHQRLSDREERQFEESYLSHPDRRERVQLIKSLTRTIDSEVKTEPGSKSLLDKIREWIPRPGSMLVFATGLASVLILLGGSWMVVEIRQLRRDLNTAQLARVEAEQRERALREQISVQQKRSEEMAAEAEKMRAAQQAATQASSPLPGIVSLVLFAAGSRQADPDILKIEALPQLEIKPGTKSVRLLLKLNNTEYPRYRVAIQDVRGGVQWSQDGLTPKKTKSGPIIEVLVPANSFGNGDFTVILSGITANDEADLIAAPVFSVHKR